MFDAISPRHPYRDGARPGRALDARGPALLPRRPRAGLPPPRPRLVAARLAQHRALRVPRRALPDRHRDPPGGPARAGPLHRPRHGHRDRRDGRGGRERQPAAGRDARRHQPRREKRHPTLGDNVTVGAGAKIIGAITIGENSRVGAGSVVVRDVPPNAVVVGVPGRVTYKDGQRVSGIDMNMTDLPDPVSRAIEQLVDRIRGLEADLDSAAQDGRSRRPARCEETRPLTRARGVGAAHRVHEGRQPAQARPGGGDLDARVRRPLRRGRRAWGMAGMLHDFDYEMHPRAPHHPVKGAEILLARGVARDVVYAILAHADYSGMPRVSPARPRALRLRRADRLRARLRARAARARSSPGWSRPRCARSSRTRASPAR